MKNKLNITNILNYPKDGKHLELYNDTSFRITKGLDESKIKTKWYAGCKTFETAKEAYLYALIQEQIVLRKRLEQFKTEELDLMESLEDE